MNLSVGIVGLPNVGKSTLFNALLKKQAAYVANFPFATIEPNIGVVPVPDERLDKLAVVVKEAEKITFLPPKVPATVKFVDIAGIIKGAHKGEGLGNKFLAHIREASAVCHVLRAFTDESVIKKGVISPKDDLETVVAELILADLETLAKQEDPGGSPDQEKRRRWQVVGKLKKELEKGVVVKDVSFDPKEQKIVKELSLLTSKPLLVVINVDENLLPEAKELEEKYSQEFGLSVDQVIVLCAKVEADLAALSPSEQRDYLLELGVKKSGLEKLIKKAFATLGLTSFLTAGEKEVRAWTIDKGILAPQAAGVIHTDFEKHFIKADVVPFAVFVENSGWLNCREKGLVETVGRDFQMTDDLVVEFKIGS